MIKTEHIISQGKLYIPKQVYVNFRGFDFVKNMGINPQFPIFFKNNKTNAVIEIAGSTLTYSVDNSGNITRGVRLSSEDIIALQKRFKSELGVEVLIQYDKINTTFYLNIVVRDLYVNDIDVSTNAQTPIYNNLGIYALDFERCLEYSVFTKNNSTEFYNSKGENVEPYIGWKYGSCGSKTRVTSEYLSINLINNTLKTPITTTNTFVKVNGNYLQQNKVGEGLFHIDGVIHCNDYSLEVYSLEATFDLVCTGISKGMKFQFFKNDTPIAAPIERYLSSGLDIGAAGLKTDVTLKYGDKVDLRATCTNSITDLTIKNLFINIKNI